jgi:ribosomal protein S18 acetylase RimI-like enzyme
MEPVKLSANQAALAVDVFCEAFATYPVMEYIIGEPPTQTDARLRMLIGFFVAARVYRKEPILAMIEGDEAVAAAIVTLPGEREIPEQQRTHRERLWSMLGPGAKKRYEVLGRTAGQLFADEPHYHLNMIGVRHSHMGRGLARCLLDEVHAMSRKDPISCGVSLTTEVPSNVPLYEHFGYRVLGHVPITSDLETWAFFRSDDVTS